MINFFTGDSPERRVERLIAQGERLFQHGKEHEGIEKFAEAAEILPEASKPSLYLGRAYFKRQEYDLALKHYYKGLYFCEITDEPGILCEIAQIYLSMRRYNIAEEKLKKALQIEPHFSLAVKGLAHIYLRTGRISDALEQQKHLLQQHPEEVQAMQRIAESHRLLGEYFNARLIIQKTLESVRSSGRYSDIKDLELQIRQLSFPDGTECGIKEHLYAKYGTICLGSAGDNGLELSSATTQVLSTTEIKVTLKRLVEFVYTFSWNPNCIVACDKHSMLLASILATLLNIPLKSVSKVSKTDCVLVCQFCLKESKQIRKVLKKLGRRTHEVITFAFITLLDEQEQEYIPDIIGIPIDKETKFSWKNANELLSHSYHETEFFGTSSGGVEGFLSQFLDGLYNLAEEENAEQQITYYRRENSLLREHLASFSGPDKAFALPGNIPPEEVVNGLLSDQKSTLYAVLVHLRNEDLQVPEILATLKTLYRDRQETWVRRMVGKLLLNAEHDASLTYLISLFYETDDILLQQSLLDTLCVSSSRKVSEVIVSALQSPSIDLREHASRYFERLDRSQQLSQLFNVLLTDIPAIIVHTIRYLKTQHSQLLQTFFPRLLGHDATEVLHETLQAVQRFRPSSCGQCVVNLLNHNDLHVVEHAIETLGYIGDIDVGYQLLPFLEHEDPQLRYAAAASLTKLDHQRSIVFLMERLRKESLDVQEKLLKLLGEAGLQETVPFIVQFAEQHLDHLQVVSAAMKTLALLKSPRSLPFMRKAAAKFPDKAILPYYISIAAGIGEEKDLETLMTFLEHPAEIQFRVAALLYRKGLKQYFHVLQDGIRSKKISINLIAIEVLAEMSDAASIELIFSLFKKENSVLDRKIVEVLSQHKDAIDPTHVRNIPSADFQSILQGIDRAIHSSRSREEVLRGMDVLCFFQGTAAVSAIQALAIKEHQSLVRCGAMKWLARWDPTEIQEIIRACVGDENIEVANTAYTLIEELNQAVVLSQINDSVVSS